MTRHPLILLPICLLWFGAVLPGQAQITYGAKAGTTFAAFAAEESLSMGGKPGVFAGAFTDYLISESFSLTGTASYALVSPTWALAPVSGGSVMIARSNTYHLNLAEVGLTVNYKLPLTFLGDLSPMVLAGHTVGYNFYTNQKSRTTLYYPSATYSAAGSENVTSSFTPFLYSVQGALRFDLPLEDAPAQILVLELGYKYTYNNVLSGPIAPTASQSANDYRMHTVYATVGVKF